MKIAICTPTWGHPTIHYTSSLFDLQGCTRQARPDIELAYLAVSGHLIEARNSIARRAMSAGADYLHWIDDDMAFPPGALIALLQHRKTVAGCNYSTRSPPHVPTAGDQAGPIHPDPQKVADRAIEPVNSLGLGFCLVSADVIRRLPADPFRPHPKHPHGLGEDVKFFEDIRALGEKVYLDHALSEQIGHVGQHVFTLKDVQAGAHRR